jgi:hypothetical protein
MIWIQARTFITITTMFLLTTPPRTTLAGNLALEAITGAMEATPGVEIMELALIQAVIAAVVILVILVATLADIRPIDTVALYGRGQSFWSVRERHLPSEIIVQSNIVAVPRGVFSRC